MAMTRTQVDLLLLNSSNYPGHPIYPYAFVQVSALARQRCLNVKRYDFLDIPKAQWADIIAYLTDLYQPRMIGLHVRQADSQVVGDYTGSEVGLRKHVAYFPVDDTRFLIDIIRRVSNIPVVVGGFGFTVHAVRMFELLKPDYGVAGAPDAFFDSFDDLVNRDISKAADIANIIYNDGNNVIFGPRVYFGPLDRPEYDETIFGDLCAFYARHGRRLSLGRLGEVDVPVELMRGCPCKCYFCTEPSVKGRRLQCRDLNAVMQDVEFLAERDVRSVWFICSELNMKGMDYPLQLAARMERFNSSRGDRRVLWKAYAMPGPGMSRGNIHYMMSAGYVPGWNEFTSFDDANLKACGMPYRARHVIQYFRDILELSRDASIYHGPPLQKFEMFLGNAFMTPEALRTTLAVVDREGFASIHAFGGAMMATRVYEIDGKINCGSDNTVFSVDRNGPLESINTMHPTFHYASSLIMELGTIAQLEEFMDFVGRTFLSHNYKLTLDIPGFLISNVSTEQFADYLSMYSILGLITTLHISSARHEVTSDTKIDQNYISVEAQTSRIWAEPSDRLIKTLYDSMSVPFVVRSLTVKELLSVLFKLNAENFEPVHEYLNLSDEADRETPYRIMRKLYQKFDSNADLLISVKNEFNLEDGSLNILQLKYFIFTNNVILKKDYRRLLFY